MTLTVLNRLCFALDSLDGYDKFTIIFMFRGGMFSSLVSTHKYLEVASRVGLSLFYPLYY